jgi:hypothetical protein
LGHKDIPGSDLWRETTQCFVCFGHTKLKIEMSADFVLPNSEQDILQLSALVSEPNEVETKQYLNVYEQTEHTEQSVTSPRTEHKR